MQTFKERLRVVPQHEMYSFHPRLNQSMSMSLMGRRPIDLHKLGQKRNESRESRLE